MKISSSRRDFLKLITNAFFGLSGALGLGGLFRFFSFLPDPGPPTEFDLGSASLYSEDFPVLQPDIPAIIKRTAEGIIAISLVCTHLGCTVEESDNSEGFTCPCHGSRYNKDGILLKGPATKNLPHFRIEEQEDGTLKLYTK